MRIGILTYHQADSFGALSQAYALQRVLREDGHDAVLVNYTNEYMKHPFALENWKKRGIVSQCLTMAGELTRIPRRKKMRQFRERHLITTSRMTKEQLPLLNEQFDLFITGSDQVWNTQINNADGAYFLDFVNDSAKKGSYAASIGASTLSERDKIWYSKQLCDFEYLNVREKSGAVLIQEITGRDAAVTIDPTLLLKKEQWEELIQDPEVEGDYILTYQVGMDRELLDYAEYLSKTYNCPIYSIPIPQGKMVNARPVLNIGIEEWLGYFRRAKYVVTDSFHGLVFSLIMEREFCVCYSVRGQGLVSRQQNLLDILGIENRNVKCIGKTIPEPLDYKKIKEKLETYRMESMQFLLEMGRVQR